MTDDFYINAYINFRKYLKDDNLCEYIPSTPCDNILLPDSADGFSFFYYQMIQEYDTQLSNDINSLKRNIIHLKAWANSFKDYSEDEVFYLHIHFLEPLVAYANDLPYAIRDRFIYSLSHLCHQANMLKYTDTKDNLEEDHKIKFSSMKRVCGGWKYYIDFEQRLKELGGEKHKEKTENYRNRFHHRMPRHTFIGLSNMVTREVDKNNRSVSYTFGHLNPISYEETINLLKEQHETAYQCFGIFQKLIENQLKEIGAYPKLIKDSK